MWWSLGCAFCSADSAAKAISQGRGWVKTIWNCCRCLFRKHRSKHLANNTWYHSSLYLFKSFLPDMEAKLLEVIFMLTEGQSWGVPQFNKPLFCSSVTLIQLLLAEAAERNHLGRLWHSWEMWWEEQILKQCNFRVSWSSLRELPQVAIAAQKLWGSASKKQSKQRVFQPSS